MNVTTFALNYNYENTNSRNIKVEALNKIPSDGKCERDRERKREREGGREGRRERGE